MTQTPANSSNGHKNKSNGHSPDRQPVPGSRGGGKQQPQPRADLLDEFTDADVDAATDELAPNLLSKNLARANATEYDIEEGRHLARAYREVIRAMTPTPHCEWTDTYGAAMLGKSESELRRTPDAGDSLALDQAHHMIVPYRLTLSDEGFSIEKIADSHAETTQRKIIEREEQDSDSIIKEVFS